MVVNAGVGLRLSVSQNNFGRCVQFRTPPEVVPIPNKISSTLRVLFLDEVFLPFYEELREIYKEN